MPASYNVPRSFGYICIAAVLSACGGGTGDAVVSTQFRPISAYQNTASDDVSFPKARDAYTLSISMTGAGYRVSETGTSAGAVEVPSATKIKFSDVSLNVEVAQKAKTIAAADLKRLVELYIAFFNRIPDADGLSYWIDQIKQGLSINQIAESFYEAAVQYSAVTGYSTSMSNADFVKVIYKNVLGRAGATAPSEDEITYWANELVTGRATKGSLISTMLTSAHSFAGNATWGWVPQLLENKSAVGLYFAVRQSLNFNTAEESIVKGQAIANAVTATDTSQALSLIGITSTFAYTPPVADAGQITEAVTSTPVAVDGSGSTSFSGQAPTFQWELQTKPAGSMASLNNSKSSRATFVPDVAGTYIAVLTAGDGSSESDKAAVTVIASPPTTTFVVNKKAQNAVVSSIGASSFYRTTEYAPVFWDFCQPYSCYGSNVPGLSNRGSFGGSGGESGIYMLELNVNGNDYPGTLLTRSFPATASSGNTLLYSVEVTGRADKLASTPGGLSSGFELSQYFSDYAQPGANGTITYSFAQLGGGITVPQGWTAMTETMLDVSISSSWTDSQGRQTFLKIPVLSKVYKGKFTDKVVLSRRLEDYSALKGAYGTYSVYVSHRVTFSR